MRAAATAARWRLLLGALGLLAGAVSGGPALRIATAEEPAPIALEGSVRNTLGEALARIEVRASSVAGWRPGAAPAHVTATARDGCFRLEGVEPGALLRVDLQDDHGSRRRALFVEAPESGTLDLGALALSTGASLEARLREEDGAPVRYAHVGAYLLGPGGARRAGRPDVTARADREGRARLEWLWPGEWRVEGRLHSGAVRWSARVTIYEAEYVEWRERAVDLALERPPLAATVSVLVTGPTGRPREGMRVTVVPLRDPPSGRPGTDAWKDDFYDWRIAEGLAGLCRSTDDEDEPWLASPERIWADFAVTGADGRARLLAPLGRLRVATADAARWVVLPSGERRRQVRPLAEAEVTGEGGRVVEVRLEVPWLDGAGGER